MRFSQVISKRGSEKRAASSEGVFPNRLNVLRGRESGLGARSLCGVPAGHGFCVLEEAGRESEQSCHGQQRPLLPLGRFAAC